MRLIILILLLSSCGHKQPVIKPAAPDTILTIKTFIAFPSDTLSFAPIYRIVKDTFDYVSVDSLTKTKLFVKDTAYYIPIHSNGKTNYVLTIKGSVYPGEDLTKAVKTLAQWVSEHKQYWPSKQDSVTKINKPIK